MQTLLSFTSKKFKAIVAATKRRNRAFHKLSLGKQRVAIANDVLAKLGAKKIVPSSTYLIVPQALERASSYAAGDPNDKKHNVDASAVLEALTSPCQVCGIGSLFIGAVAKADRLTLAQLNEVENGHYDESCSTRESEISYLKKWFDRDQLDLVEAYFEQGSCGEHYPTWDSPISQAPKSRRLVMIMENIVSNRGRFHPYKGKHRVTEESTDNVDRY